jgi:hypothetical protein
LQGCPAAVGNALSAAEKSIRLADLTNHALAQQK